MVAITRINRSSLEFPATDQALTYPNGLLAVGGDLGVERLLNAYRAGIFPWYEDPQPIMWWSPDPRSVLFPDELHISRSLRKSIHQSDYHVTADRAFHRVISGCADPRAEQQGTWITNAMGRAYMELHRMGYGHSIEVWDAGQQLIGGLYGVALGRVFYGESMFSRRANASKMALLALVQLIRPRGYKIIDCQVESDHLNSMGARNIPRLDFEQYLAHTGEEFTPDQPWRLDQKAGELL